ncbi:MAG TPA: hypothetical protein PLV82_04635, partial [bacterium]|nr:hypothetical protein [bacterium]
MPETIQPNPHELDSAYKRAEGTSNTQETVTPKEEDELTIDHEQLRVEINSAFWRQLLVSKQRVLNNLNNGTIDSDTAETQLALIQEELNKVSPEQRFSEEINKLFKEGADKNEIAGSLCLLDTPLAWQIREELLKANIIRRFRIAHSLTYLDSERAWQMREEFLKDADGSFKYAIALSLTGLNSERAWRMREELLKDADDDLKSSIARSLTGLNSKQAW